MFHQDTLPTIEEAIPAMVKEESRLKAIPDSISSMPRPIFAATRIKDDRVNVSIAVKLDI